MNQVQPLDEDPESKVKVTNLFECSKRKLVLVLNKKNIKKIVSSLLTGLLPVDKVLHTNISGIGRNIEIKKKQIGSDISK